MVRGDPGGLVNGACVTDLSLSWHCLPTKADARELEAFTCTTDPPRTARGRRLRHPRPWEWEAQRHLRAASQHLRVGDALLVGRDVAGAIAAAAHVDYDDASGLLVAYINALGVATSLRNHGGATADEALHVVRLTAVEETVRRRCASLLLTGKIHRDNSASQYACRRAGLEPTGLSSGEYQTWVLEVTI